MFDGHRFDRAVARAGELVLHLHGLEHDQALAGRDRPARLDVHPDDEAGHGRRDHLVAANSGGPTAELGQPSGPLVLDPNLQRHALEGKGDPIRGLRQEELVDALASPKAAQARGIGR